jgi:hypothetical protein
MSRFRILVVLARDAVVVAIEPVRVGVWAAVIEEKALRLGLAAEIGTISVAAGTVEGSRCRFGAC